MVLPALPPARLHPRQPPRHPGLHATPARRPPRPAADDPAALGLALPRLAPVPPPPRRDGPAPPHLTRPHPRPVAVRRAPAPTAHADSGNVMTGMRAVLTDPEA